MITYAAINLTNKKFYVGSTTDFDLRCKKHHKNEGDLAFHRSLRKNPENFYWIVGEDDRLETRYEEQYYLDFYHGTVWCYNLRPSAESGGNTCSNTTWWNNGKENRRSKECPGEGWVIGKIGKPPGHWWNNGVTTVRSHECPGDGWVRGSLHRRNNYLCGENHPSFGKSRPNMLWWNNGDKNRRSGECPGEDWVRGRLKRSK